MPSAGSPLPARRGEGPSASHGGARNGAVGREDAVVGARGAGVANRLPEQANWLPDDEASQLCIAFAREMEGRYGLWPAGGGP